MRCLDCDGILHDEAAVARGERPLFPPAAHGDGTGRCVRCGAAIVGVAVDSWIEKLFQLRRFGLA